MTDQIETHNRPLTSRTMQGAAVITLQNPSMAGRLLPDAMQDCKNNQKTVSILFLWFMCGAPEHDEECVDMPQINDLCKMLKHEFGWWPGPVVGLADGWVSYTGSRMLGLCDFVIVTSAALFRTESHFSMDACKAWELGLVSHIVGSALQLTTESEAMRAQFMWCPPDALREAKLRLRDMRSQIFNEIVVFKDADQPKPAKKGDEQRTGADGPCTTSRKRGGKKKKTTHLPEPPPPQYFDGPVTTLMVRHIPCCVTQDQFAEVLTELGFERKYDLLNMPTDSRTEKTGSSNLGYVFVNFLDPESAEAFQKAIEGYKFEGTSSAKACTSQPAHVQGFRNTLDHLQQSKTRARGNFACTL